MIPRPDPNQPATDKRVYGVVDPHADTVKMSSQQADALEAAHMLDLAEDLKRRLLAASKFDDAFLVGWLMGEVRRG